MYKYYLYKNLRNVMFLFWSLIFPLALMTCMYLAFGNVYDMMNSIDPLPTVLVMEDDSEFSEGFRDILLTMSDEDAENRYFILDEAESREEAEKSTQAGDSEIMYVVSDGNIDVYLPSDHSQTAGVVSQAVANSYRNKYTVIKDAFERDPQAALKILEDTEEMESFTKAREDVFSGDPNMYSWYFYSSLVMGICFNATGGAQIVSDLKADVSSVASRFSASPEKKSRMLLYSFLARLTPSLVINAIQLTVMKTVFHISLGNDPVKLVIFILASNIFALSFGIIAGLIFKGTLENRANKITAVVMISVFLSGEMINTLPGSIEQHCPIVNDINPATVMNLAFYRMSIFNDSLDFYLNMAKIIGFGVIFLVIGTIILRREKYASL